MFEPYTIGLHSEYGYCIKVWRYNPTIWYPWSQAYLCENGYPTTDVKRAWHFSTKRAAQEVIDKILKNNN